MRNAKYLYIFWKTLEMLLGLGVFLLIVIKVLPTLDSLYTPVYSFLLFQCMLHHVESIYMLTKAKELLEADDWVPITQLTQETWVMTYLVIKVLVKMFIISGLFSHVANNASEILSLSTANDCLVVFVLQLAFLHTLIQTRYITRIFTNVEAELETGVEYNLTEESLTHHGIRGGIIMWKIFRITYLTRNMLLNFWLTVAAPAPSATRQILNYFLLVLLTCINWEVIIPLARNSNNILTKLYAKLTLYQILFIPCLALAVASGRCLKDKDYDVEPSFFLFFFVALLMTGLFALFESVSLVIKIRHVYRNPDHYHNLMQPQGLSAEEIEALNSSFYRKEGASVEICSICYLELATGDEIFKLQCNHLFHRGCLEEWLKRNSLCPLCRKEVRAGDARPDESLQHVELQEIYDNEQEEIPEVSESAEQDEPEEEEDDEEERPRHRGRPESIASLERVEVVENPTN